MKKNSYQDRAEHDQLDRAEPGRPNAALLVLTDTGENVQKWTRVFSTRRWVILDARTRRKKEKKIACPFLDVFTCGQVHKSWLLIFHLDILFRKQWFELRHFLTVCYKLNIEKNWK